MFNDKSISIESSESSIVKNSGGLDDLKVVGRFDVVCVAADGTVRWKEVINNLVVTAGKVDILEKYFRTAYTPAWYVGLTVSSGYLAADTLAVHAGWTEFTSYTVSGNATNRGTLAFAAAAANGANGQITTSAATAFTVTAGGTIDGALVTQTQAKATTTGVLWSCGTFSGGARVVQNTDTLNVSYTATIT